MTAQERIQAIDARLKDALTVASIDITDDSHLHSGHTSHGGAGHFTVCVVSDDFAGKNRVKRHQLVYAAVAELMGVEIHALAIEAKTQNEVDGER